MRTHHLASTVIGISLAFAGSAAAQAAKPNIIVIVSDDCGYNEFSLHNSKLFQTPRIDSIASNGVLFSNGYVSGTVCSPSRAGLLTGRYQESFGHEFNIPPAYNEENGLPLTEATIADGLKSGGYATVGMGKWHLGYAPKFHPQARGFDHYYGFLQGSRNYFPLEKSGRLNALLDDRTPVNPEKGKFDYMTDELGRAATDYIVKNKAKPFFMYLAFNATHTPHQALRADIAAVEKLSPDDVKVRAMALALDRAVGKVLDTLQEQGLTDNTLLIFVNDNGGATGRDNFPLRGYKGQTWEGGMRVAFAMQWPAVLPKNKVYDNPIIALDIMPTALAAAGITNVPGKSLDGVNLIPYLTGKNTARPHQTLYWKSGETWAVRDGDLKAVVGDPSVTSPALFDLSKDPEEKYDLASSRATDVERLKKMYVEWKRDFPPTIWGRSEMADEDDSAADDATAKKPGRRAKARK